MLGKTEADQAYRLKKSLPPELRKIIMTCNSVDSIVDIINQMQAMNSLGLKHTTPAVATNNPAMPFMTTQSNMTEKKVPFSDPLSPQMSDPLLQSLHVITQKLDSCVTGMNNLRTDLRSDCDRSRNRDKSGDDCYYRDRSRKRDKIDITETKTIGLTTGKVETIGTGIEIMTYQEIMIELDPVEVLTKYMS